MHKSNKEMKIQILDVTKIADLPRAEAPQHLLIDLMDYETYLDKELGANLYNPYTILSAPHDLSPDSVELLEEIGRVIAKRDCTYFRFI